MTTVNDTFALEEILTRNMLDTRWFLPFTIYRLQPFAINRAVTFTVTLQNVSEAALLTRSLRLTWTMNSESLAVPPIQEHIITEWAACGIACAVVPLYTNLQLLQVTQIGDSFDYWIGDTTEEFGLEISGTLAGDFEQRHRAKVRQLHKSVHKVAGYVSVTSFQTQRTLLSFHRL